MIRDEQHKYPISSLLLPMSSVLTTDLRSKHIVRQLVTIKCLSVCLLSKQKKCIIHTYVQAIENATVETSQHPTNMYELCMYLVSTEIIGLDSGISCFTYGFSYSSRYNFHQKIILATLPTWK